MCFAEDGLWAYWNTQLYMNIPPSGNVIQQFNVAQSSLKISACQLHHTIYRLTLNTMHSTLFTLTGVHC